MYGNKTIEIKGTGKVTAKPDTIVISLKLESIDKDYNLAMDEEARKIAAITEALEKVGFDKDALKTTNFKVDTETNRYRDSNDNYHEEFAGYSVKHSLKVEFDLDVKRLSRALSAIAQSKAAPQLSVAFTVKDPQALSQAILRDAAVNARRNAEVLCEASGVTLGQLLSIDYSWGEIRITSNTEYGVLCDCMGSPSADDIDIEPEDIVSSDQVTFVWEIQ